MDFNSMRQKPARQPAAIAPGLIRNDDALDRRPASHSLVTPTVQKPQQLEFIRLIRFELLQRLACDARNDAADQPARQAQLDDGNQGAALNKGRDGPAQVVKLWHQNAPSVG